MCGSRIQDDVNLLCVAAQNCNKNLGSDTCLYICYIFHLNCALCAVMRVLPINIKAALCVHKKNSGP